MAIIIIIGGGYLLLRNTSSTPTTPATTAPTTDTTMPATSTAPAAPLTLSAPTVVTSPNTTVSSSSAFVTGQVVPNGVSTTYWFEYGETSSFTNRSASQEIGSGFAAIATPAFIIGLKSNTLYYYRLMASNNLGTVYGTNYTFTTNSNPAPQASAPTASTNSASSVTRASATLNATVNPKGFETNYWFEYGTDSKLGNTTSIVSINDNLTSSQSVTSSLTGLQPLTKYYFRINAQNEFGTVNGSTLSFTTPGPANPGAPTVTINSATGVTSSSANLNGRINPNGADTTYWFEYGTDSLLSNIIGSGTAQEVINAGTNTVSVQANINSLSNDTRYYYHLVGTNQYGTVNSAILSFTTRP